MRRLLPVLLACAVLPLAAGCGAEDSVKSTVDPVAQAAEPVACLPQKLQRFVVTLQPGTRAGEDALGVSLAALVG